MVRLLIESPPQSRLKFADGWRALAASPLAIAAAAAVGVAAALAAFTFVEIVAALNRIFLIAKESRSNADPLLVALATLAVPTAAGFAVGFIVRKIKSGAPHGPADVLLAAQSPGRLPLKDGVRSALASVIALGGGASLGQYGPLAHLGAVIGGAFSRVFGGAARIVVPPKTAMACGVAAAIAAAFNAPIAGLVFAHEVVLRRYALGVFAPVAVAAFSGHALAVGALGREPFLPVEHMAKFGAGEAASFLALGAACGILAAFYMGSAFRIADAAAHWRIPKILRPAAAGFLTGAIALAVPEALGIGKPILESAIGGFAAVGAKDIALLLTAKFIATALCLGLGVAGGIVAPTLVIGALFGGLAGMLAQILLGDAASPLLVYAVCGMFALASPVIGAPLSGILIVLELTRNYPLTVAAMLAIVVANLVAHRLSGGSYYARQLSRRGVDLRDSQERRALAEIRLGGIASENYVSASREDSPKVVQRRLLESGKNEAHIIFDDGRYAGTVRLGDIVRAMESDDSPNSVLPLMRPAMTLAESSNAAEAMERMGGFVGESAPVIDGDGRLMGVVRECDVLAAYAGAASRMREEES